MRRFICICILFFLLAGLYAEVTTELSLHSGSGYQRESNTDSLESFGSTGGAAHISFFSNESDMIRPRFELKTTIDYSSMGLVTTFVEVPKLYLKTRMPFSDGYTIRSTSGKETYSWGEGQIYNAADTINGARYASLTDTLGRFDSESFVQEDTKKNQQLDARSVKDGAVWGTGIFFPMGRYSFTEFLVGLPIDIAQGILFSLKEDGNGLNDTQVKFVGAGIDSSRSNRLIGFRTQFKAYEIKTEVGYMYRPFPLAAQQGEHQPFISIQGNLLADLYASNAFHITPEGDFSYDVGAGLFYGTGNFAIVHALDFRVEGLYQSDIEKFHIYSDIGYTYNDIMRFGLNSEMRFSDGYDGVLLNTSYTTDRNGRKSILQLGLLFNTETLVTIYYTGLVSYAF